MNLFTLIAGQKMGLPFTNNSRFVELTLNGSYEGLYQLTEQIEQSPSRVNIDEKEGILISLDLDDGPSLNPPGGDNFWSTVYRLPVCVKYPEDPPADKLLAVQNAFATLERAISASDYETTALLMDIESFIDYMLIQELVYNVEMAAPRSVFIYKDKGGRWTMGPLWDFDAGFDFDWATMYTGHNYFASYQELVFGTDPSQHTNGYNLPAFFTDLFRIKRFVSEYKARWSEIRPLIMSDYWLETEMYILQIADAMKRNAIRWPIDKNYDVEQQRMKQWLENRIYYLNIVIAGYPTGT
jgi:hypothetical protein